MKNYYQVKLSKRYKYFGETDENFKNKEIYEEDYTLHYSDYKVALANYKEECINGANWICVQYSFVSTYTIQLLSFEDTTPEIEGKHKMKIEHQITISNL
jgi:hypothetical protein